MEELGFDEEKCKCGMSIQKGYGYYNYHKELKCFGCGRINQKLILSWGKRIFYLKLPFNYTLEMKKW